MSRLEELINELCPYGVEYKTIGEIATDIYRGSGIKRTDVSDFGTPCVRYGEIYTTYDIWFEVCVSHTDETKIANPKFFEHGDILFAITGENVEEIAKSIAYLGHDRCVAGGDIVVLKHNQNPKYLSYALSTTEAQNQKSKGRVKSKVVHSNVPAIKAIKLPVPPLEVQREIVRILDNFTLLTAELTAELTARKEQYEYYKEYVYNNISNADTVKTCDVTTNRYWLMPATPKYLEHGVPYITSKNVRNGKIDFSDVKYISREDYDEVSKNRAVEEGDLLITMIGTIGESAFVPSFTEFYGQNLYLLRFNREKCIPEYFYHYINSKAIKESLVSRKNPSSQGYIKAGSIDNLEIPLPLLEEQKRIVSMLNKFETLCSDISAGLPAEIEARQKQYEYYRDKLLTFKEKES